LLGLSDRIPDWVGKFGGFRLVAFCVKSWPCSAQRIRFRSNHNLPCLGEGCWHSGHRLPLRQMCPREQSWQSSVASRFEAQHCPWHTDRLNRSPNPVSCGREASSETGPFAPRVQVSQSAMREGGHNHDITAGAFITAHKQSQLAKRFWGHD
jgi:hypothetical protein